MFNIDCLPTIFLKGKIESQKDQPAGLNYKARERGKLGHKSIFEDPIFVYFCVMLVSLKCYVKSV